MPEDAGEEQNHKAFLCDLCGGSLRSLRLEALMTGPFAFPVYPRLEVR
jgi:hypothetical protein